jgi:hypothetical protein
MSCCSITPKKINSSIIERSKPYKPLIVMVLVVSAGSIALSSLGLSWMTTFMGLFLLNFAMFKLFDIHGFAKSFAMYDIIGKYSPAYAKIYPFIELALAIGFLAHQYLTILNAITAIIMAVGLIGILKNRASGHQTRCACMGNLINVPVGSITILENTSMILMAIIMLLHSH